MAQDEFGVAPHQPGTRNADAHAYSSLDLVAEPHQSTEYNREHFLGRSATGHLLQLFGVPSPLHRDL
jgi:hypothetical protein